MTAALLHAHIQVRVATRNIKNLTANVSGDRRDNIENVIDLLDADVIGLQEINNSAALEHVFDDDEWNLVIDEESGSPRDLALAVRRPWRVEGVDDDIEADDEHFLFPASTDNPAFPERRDVLCIEVSHPTTNVSFHVMVIHAKSRAGTGGRPANDHRRIEASRRLVEIIRADYHSEPFVLLGDFNDNPDDASLNVLEFGYPDIPGGPEEIAGPFMINLTEPLMAAGHVSHGLRSDAIVGDRINTIDLGSRDRNNEHRGENVHTGDILFDQILIPGWMTDCCVGGSVHVFNHAVAIEGNSSTRASDHVPVYADLLLGADQEGEGENGTNTPNGTLTIVGLLPNPLGRTDNHAEMVRVRNDSNAPVNLAQWRLIDRSNNDFRLSTTLDPGETIVLTLERSAMLNNSGDDVWMERDGSSTHVSARSYVSTDAMPGRWVVFP